MPLHICIAGYYPHFPIVLLGSCKTSSSISKRMGLHVLIHRGPNETCFFVQCGYPAFKPLNI